MRFASPVLGQPLPVTVDYGAALEYIVFRLSAAQPQITDGELRILAGMAHSKDHVLHSLKRKQTLGPRFVAERQQRGHGTSLDEGIERHGSADSHALQRFDQQTFCVLTVGKLDPEWL